MSCDHKGYCLVWLTPQNHGCHNVCVQECTVSHHKRVCMHVRACFSLVCVSSGTYSCDVDCKDSLRDKQCQGVLRQLFEFDAKSMWAEQTTKMSHKPNLPKVKAVWPQRSSHECNHSVSVENIGSLGRRIDFLLPHFRTATHTMAPVSQQIDRVRDPWQLMPPLIKHKPAESALKWFVRYYES